MTREPNSPDDYDYQVGGALQHDHHTYIPRGSDEKLFDFLTNGGFCYVLSSRQTGKTSLLRRTKNHFEKHQIRCASIYMASLTIPSDTDKKIESDVWYQLIANELASNLEIQCDLDNWWKARSGQSVEKLAGFINEILLEQLSTSVVIFIDEIDSIKNLKFSNDSTDDFFNLLIDICEKQEKNFHSENSKKLSFAIFGVAIKDELIKDKKIQKRFLKTAKEIKLPNFSEIREKNILEPGLQKKIQKEKFSIALVMKEIFSWTNGQPFLTQLICDLVQSYSKDIGIKSESQIIFDIVQEQIIKAWKNPLNSDKPINTHLRSIEDQISVRGKQNRKILTAYKKLLHQGTQGLKFNNSREQQELLISGLVIEVNNKLFVYNKIYRQIFDQEWVEKLEKDLCFFESEFTQWKEDCKPDHLLRSEVLDKALRWSFPRRSKLPPKQQEFLEKSIANNQDYDPIKNHNFKTIIIAVLAILLCGTGGGILILKNLSQDGNEGTSTPPVRISNGDRLLFDSKNLLDMGIEKFKVQNFQEAKKLFDKARSLDPSNPLPVIFSHNANLFTRNTNKYTIAIVIPDNYRVELVHEILRGVADAQEKSFENSTISFNISLVEISTEAGARDIVKTIIADSNVNVIGIIAVNVNLSQEDIKLASRKFLPIMLPVSNDLSPISSNNIFQTSYPSGEISKILAKRVLMDTKVAIFYDSSSKYSQSVFDSLKQNLPNFLKEEYDIASNDPSYILSKINSDNSIKSVILLPDESEESIQKIIDIATKIRRDREDRGSSIEMIGSPALYQSQTLQEGGKNLKGLILAVPWPDSDANNYGEGAKNKWQGKISWRTATSYDAARALMKSMSQVTTENQSPDEMDRIRKDLYVNLRSLPLGAEETSGDRLQFSETGERKTVDENPRPPYFVRVSDGQKVLKPPGAEVGFESYPRPE